MSARKFHPQLLVSTEWLAGHVNDLDLRILDATAHMVSQPTGPSIVTSARADWERGHIPNSAYLSMVDDLCAPGQAKPYAFPDATQVARSLQRLGVHQRSHIVLYGSGAFIPVTRVWWVLRAYGFDKVSILDGGWEKWLREGREVSVAARVFAPSDVAPQLCADRIADRAQVLAAIDVPGVSIVNALSAQQHHGTGGSTYGRVGRIPGSVNLPSKELLDPQGTWIAADAMVRKFQAVGAMDAERIITYCGGGVAATAAAFALAVLGHEKVAVYEGSLIDWCAHPELPMAVG